MVCEFHWRMSRVFVILFLLLLTLFVSAILNVPSYYVFVCIVFWSVKVIIV